MEQQQWQRIPCSLGRGPLEEYTTLTSKQRENEAVTGAIVLETVETRSAPLATQWELSQDFKLATQEDNEGIREWAQWARTRGQRAFATLAHADPEQFNGTGLWMG